MKKILFLASFALFTLSASSQNIFGNGPEQVQSEVERWFSPVIAIIAIVGLLIIVGTNFIGNNIDIKKGLTGILVLVIAVGVIISAYAFITSLSL